MAIQIPVSATADDRTFRQIATKYEKWGKDTGKKIGAGLADGIDDPKIEKAFSKVGDAMSKVRAEEAKLQDLRNRGASDSKIVVQSEALARARSAEVRATNDAVRAYDGMHASTTRLSSATTALSGALSGTRFGALATDVSNLSSKFGSLGAGVAGAVVGVTAIATATIAASAALYQLGSTWDDIGDKISMRTGKYGDDLQGITDSVKRVASDTAVPIEKIGDIAGQVVQYLKLTGPELDEMTQRLSILDEAGNGVGVRELAKTFNLFGVEAKDGAKTLDELFNVSQKTGIPIQELVGNLQNAGRASREFGLDMGQTAGLLSSFEAAGLDAGKVTPALTFALKNFAKDGKEAGPALAEVVQRIQELADAHRNDEAQALAVATFGGKSYIDMLGAIKDHKVDVDQISTAFQSNGDDIKAAAEKTEDWKEELVKLKNELQTGLAPAADFVFSSINNYLKGFKDDFDFLKWILPGGGTPSNLGQPTPIAPGSPLGNMLSGGPGGPTGSQLSDVLLGGGPGVAPPKPQSAWDQWHSADIWAAQGRGGPGAADPTKPVVPMTGDPMSLLQGFAPTSALYGAAEGVLSSQHDQAQAEAELNALRSSNVAKAEEIQAAENKLAKAKTDEYQAELRLNEAKQSSMEKFTTQMKDASAGMEELGAGLDKDLGISKGLSGMADNLVRFLGSLAAAPLMGQLNAMSQAQGGIAATGSGLMGALGASGAFGPQYQIGGYDQNGKPYSLAQAQSMGLGGSSSSSSRASFAPGASTGQPYGLPGGTDTGGYGSSGNAFPAWVHQLEDAFGVKASTYAGHQESNRNEAGYAPNPQGQNRGIDWSGPVDAMQNFADYLSQIPGSLEQVIWDNPNTGQTTEIAGGRAQPGYFAGDLADHQNHVHTRQSTAIPAPGGGTAGGTAIGGAPGSPNWNAIAQSESGSNWAINTGNGYYGGLQFSQSSWEAAGGTQVAPRADLASPQQQQQIASQLYAMQGPSAWPNTFQSYDQGGPLPPGTTVVQNNTGKPETVVNPQGMVGDQHVSSMFPGPGPGNAPGNPAAGNAAAAIGQQGPTAIGGAEKRAAPGGGASAGAGVIGMATGAASMAADAIAPGSGQAVQVAGKLAERAIKFGGQLAGVGVQGLMETFLPTGGSELANNNWLNRIGGAFAGASPQLPNLAGKPSTPVPPPAPSQPMPFPTAPGAANANSGDQRPININLNGVGNVDQTSLNHFTGDISRAVNMPGMSR